MAADKPDGPAPTMMRSRTDMTSTVRQNGRSCLSAFHHGDCAFRRRIRSCGSAFGYAGLQKQGGFDMATHVRREALLFVAVTALVFMPAFLAGQTSAPPTVASLGFP